MPPPKWYFREFRPGDNASDPDFARALFSRDDSAAARSLVRESVQNSLDARSGSAPVRVRFVIRTGARAAASGQALRFFDGAWSHLESPESGIDDAPEQTRPVPYLVIEDFGTNGLVGDPRTWNPLDAGKNSFFLFFRALGRSGKQGEDRGRWGVGKFVFPMASQGHCLIGLTISDDASPLLMGRMVLKTHSADGLPYHPDGHWGERAGDGLVVPVSDGEHISTACRVFELERRSETGLSIVVPWVNEAVSSSRFSEAAASEYFLPILRGELIVDVDVNGSTERVDASQIAQLAATIPDAVARARIDLGMHAATWPDSQLLRVPAAASGNELEWGGARIPDDQRAQAAVKLEAGEPIAVRIPTLVREKNKPARTAHFDVFLQHVGGLGRVRPLIVRESIAVSEDKTRMLQDYVALVVVDEPPLSGFIGDAETPAHSELQYDLVKVKYVYAGKLLQLVRDAAFEIIREIEGGDVNADEGLLAEFFPRPEPSPRPKRVKSREASAGDETEEVPEIVGRPPRFRITKLAGGFAVRGTGSASPGTRVAVDCAYDVRRGNPLRKYRPADFAIGRDILCEAAGADVELAEDNRVLAKVQDSHFELVFSGFDENRNVIVRVTAESPEDAE